MSDPNIREKYYELLYAVETKHPGESRHETALRYIQHAENRPACSGQVNDDSKCCGFHYAEDEGAVYNVPPTDIPTGGDIRRGLAPKWQPIETAPSDCKEILGCHLSTGLRRVCWRRSAGDDRYEYGLGKERCWRPTHWMPLPEPPYVRGGQMTALREYQTQAVHDLRVAVKEGSRSPLLVAPTGSGKTACAAELIRRARERCQTVLFLAPRRELVYQVEQRIVAMGFDYSLIMSGEEMSSLPAIQVASIATLHERAMRRDRIELPEAGLVILDEAHEATFGRSKEILNHYRERSAVVVGLTATPARPSDGRGLGEVYDVMIEGPTTRQLIDMEYLVPPRHFKGEAPNLEGVKVKGDYVAKEVSERMKEPTLVGSVVANWFRLASERQTLVFAHDVPFSRELCDRFTENGIAAAHIDAKTPNTERKEINDRFHSGELQVVCNVGIYVYGVDFPNLSAIVLAKPTKSIVRYLQMCGRGLRVGDQYPDCLILDHANCIDDCGFVDDEQPWTLDGKKKIQDEKKDKGVKEPKEIECPKCGEVFRAKPQCPGCGHEMRSEYRKSVVELDAELAEIDRKERKSRAREWSLLDKARFLSELLGHARYKGYKQGWAVHAYEERLGVKPWPVWPQPPTEPGQETKNWITSRNIRNAKRREKQRAQA